MIRASVTARRGRGCRVAISTVALLVAAAGCGGGRAPETTATPPDSQPAPRPLASMATQPVALLPAQYVRAGDSTGWAGRVGPPAAFLRAIDGELAAQLADRGTARSWMLPDALARMARRNPANTSDPYALSAEGLRAGVRRSDPSLGEPLASQIRGLIALTDARYALVPVEVRFERAAEGGRAILRLALLDGRLSRILGSWDISTTPAPEPIPAALAAELGEKAADLVASR